jgi:two-component system sensor histidine kinase EvgS
MEEALRADADGQEAIGLLLQSLGSALQARSLQA